MSETGSPGRYSRSFSGLVGAMIVIVLGVLAFVGLRSLTGSPDEPFAATPVDYLSTVAQAQAGGVDLVYPRELPSGWKATSVTFRPGQVPGFAVSLLTDDQAYVGVREEATPLTELLSTYVDADYADAEAIDVPGAVATRWQGFTDAGGDTAYAATIGQRQVLVFGSASPAQLESVITSLTEATLAAVDDGAAQPTG